MKDLMIGLDYETDGNVTSSVLFYECCNIYSIIPDLISTIYNS